MWPIKFPSIYQVEVASPGTLTPSEPPHRLSLTFTRQQAKKPTQVKHQLSWMECLLLQQSRGLTEGEMTEWREQWGRKGRRESRRMNSERAVGRWEVSTERTVPWLPRCHSVPPVCLQYTCKWIRLRIKKKTKNNLRRQLGRKEQVTACRLCVQTFTWPLCLRPLLLLSPLPPPQVSPFQLSLAVPLINVGWDWLRNRGPFQLCHTGEMERQTVAKVDLTTRHTNTKKRHTLSGTNTPSKAWCLARAPQTAIIKLYVCT